MNWTNLKVWAHGLAAAAIGGAASAATTYFIAPQLFTFDKAGAIAISKAVILGAIIPAMAYLKQSPVPALSVTTQTDMQTSDGTESTKSSVTITKN